MWVWCQQAICSMPSVQQQKTLVLKRPVLFAEQINPVSLPSVVLNDQGCRRQKLPVQSNTKVLDRWWHGAPKIQSLKFIRSEIGSQCSSYRAGDTWSRGFKSTTSCFLRDPHHKPIYVSAFRIWGSCGSSLVIENKFVFTEKSMHDPFTNFA